MMREIGRAHGGICRYCVLESEASLQNDYRDVAACQQKGCAGMKTAVVYYTFGGSAKKEAERLIKERGAELFRVYEARKRSLFGAFASGCYQAMHRKAAAILPLNVNFAEYDRITICCPVWAGYPAPAFNAVAALLPSGKEIEVFLCSAGGETPKSEQGTKQMITDKGCKLIAYHNVKTGAVPAKSKG